MWIFCFLRYKLTRYVRGVVVCLLYTLLFLNIFLALSLLRSALSMFPSVFIHIDVSLLPNFYFSGDINRTKKKMNIILGGNLK
jgi:hypothetical protein